MVPVIISEKNLDSTFSKEKSKENTTVFLQRIASSANYDQVHSQEIKELLERLKTADDTEEKKRIIAQLYSLIPFSLMKQLLEGDSLDKSSMIHILEKMDLDYFLSVDNIQDILQAIHDRRVDLQNQKDYWREYLKEHEVEDYPDISSMVIMPNENGAGACYFVFDIDGLPRYIIKPVDEDIFCINNHKGYIGVFVDENHRVRRAIPLYRSAQTDVVTYQIAEIIGSGSITPKTWMMIVKSSDFYDLTDPLSIEELQKIVEETGDLSKEKLCSIQEFIYGARDLAEVYFDYQAEGKPFILDQEDFELVHLLLWTSFDTDAHIYNLMVYKKKIDENGNIIWGIKKVDNGLAFPEKNIDFRNMLDYFPNADKPMSDELKDKIRNLPKEEIIGKLDEFGLSACVDAFIQRLTLMQENVDQVSTIKEVNELMFDLASKNDTWWVS